MPLRSNEREFHCEKFKGNSVDSTETLAYNDIEAEGVLIKLIPGKCWKLFGK